MRANFGYPATWIKADASEINKQVLYKQPTDKYDFGTTDYSLERHVLEYYETDFPGLFESVQEANNEKIKIEKSEGVFVNFIIKRCEKLADGKMIKAFLTEV